MSSNLKKCKVNKIAERIIERIRYLKTYPNISLLTKKNFCFLYSNNITKS